jgi:hypothetical protein
MCASSLPAGDSRGKKCSIAGGSCGVQSHDCLVGAVAQPSAIWSSSSMQAVHTGFNEGHANCCQPDVLPNRSVATACPPQERCRQTET